MNNETLELCAYHESGRVVFAYQCGYSCDSIQLSESDPGKGDSKINASPDVDYINVILSGKWQSLPDNTSAKYIEVAKNLMKIAWAGNCAEEFYSSAGLVDVQTEVNPAPQDLKYINLIQAFLKNRIPSHPADYPSKVTMSVFQAYKKPELWKAVDAVAKAALQSPEKPLPRFYIEDALMSARFEIKKQNRNSGFGIGLQEEKVHKEAGEAKRTVAASLSEEKQLDTVLKDFLRKVRKEWTEEELQLSVRYLKGVFKKFGP